MPDFKGPGQWRTQAVRAQRSSKVHAVQDTEFGYNPGQARDDQGRWSGHGGHGGGGGGGTGGGDSSRSVTRDASGALVVTEESKRLAHGVYEQSTRLEPAISAEVAGLAGDTHPAVYHTPPPAQMFGWEFRRKEEATMAGKVERYVADEGLTRAEGAAEIKDAVRYTVHFADADYQVGSQHVLDGLARDNKAVRVKNTWAPDSTYRGINAQVTRADGMRYEVQFHTPASQRVKDQMHVMYAEQRVLPKGGLEWTRLDNAMKGMASGLTFPPGAGLVGL